MRIGAYHFANKPFNLDDVVATVARALETTRLRREVRQLRAKEARPFSLNNIVGISDPIAALRNLVAKVATSPASTVLLTGESGTGKDLVAKVLHYSSDRSVPPVHEHHLLGAAGDAARKRALRPRARRVHGCAGAETGHARERRRRHGLSRRDWRDGPGPPGQAPAVPGGKGIQARGRDHRCPRRRTGHCRDQPQPRGRGCEGTLPPGPLLSPERAPDCPATVAGACGRHSGPGRVLRRRLQPGVPQERARLDARRAFVCSSRTAGRATCASCATSSSARCCSARATGSSHRTSRPCARRRSPATGFELPANGLDLEQVERQFVVQALKRSGGNQTKAAALLGLNRDQIRYRIEKFGLAVPREESARVR